MLNADKVKKCTCKGRCRCKSAASESSGEEESPSYLRALINYDSPSD